jgi:5'-deoxynucleotidase YfbR-like HD superfamily hydrolase
MYTKINFDAFAESFVKMGRKGQFSTGGLRALFDYYEALEDDLDEVFELDVIALCCEWSEYKIKELPDVFDEFEWETFGELSGDELMRYIKDVLEDKTTVLDVGGDSGSVLVVGY